MGCKFIIFVLLLGSGAASAADWVPYATSPEGDKTYLDIGSVLVRGNKRLAWIKTEKASPVTYEGGMLSGWTARIEVDCKERTQRTISEVGHQPNGSMLYQVTEQIHSSPVVPETLGEIRLEAICKFSRKKRPS